MSRQIRFRKFKDTNLREVVIDGAVIGVAQIQEPERGRPTRRVLFDPLNQLAGAWGGKMRIFPTLERLRSFLNSYKG
jgi:hypothetical protein